MFENLQDLTFKRTAKQAIGFYLTYFSASFVFAASSSWIVGLAFGKTGNAEFSLKVGQFSIILFASALSYLMIKKKNLMNDKLKVGLAVFASILTIVGGGILGFIPLAYLSTVSSGETKNSIKSKDAEEEELEVIEGEVIK